MSDTSQRAFGSSSSRDERGAQRRSRRGGVLATVTAVVFAVALLAAPGAGAVVFQNTGSFSDPALLAPRAIAVDPESGDVFVAEFIGDELSPGSLLRFDASGTPLSPASMGSGYYSAVAVEQGGDHTVYGGAGGFGETEHIEAFTSAGSPVGSPFPLEVIVGGQIASDSAGNIYILDTTFSVSTATVKKYTSAAIAGTPAEFACAGSDCNSTAFSEPRGVAVDAGGNVYVADTGNGRVVKFNPDGSYDSVFYEGAAQDVAVDTASGMVLVSGNDEGLGFHVTALDSSGNVIGEIPKSEFKEDFLVRLAVNPTTHTVYAVEFGETSQVSIYSILLSPTATTEPASGVKAESATLNATVNPEGVLNEDCHFEYTDDADFQANEWANATSVPCEPEPFDEETDVAVSAEVSGLGPSTTYDYRVVESTEGGTTNGDPLQLTTLTPPTATTGAASAISQHTATLAATVNPNGEATTNCHIEWGPAAGNYSSGQAPCSPDPGSASTDTAVSGPASGLAANTTYHYRVVQSTAAGKASGTDKSFATLADTCATNAALCPPAGGGGGSTPPPAGGSIPPPAQKPLKCKKGFKKKKVHGKFKCVKLKKKHKKH